MKHIYIIILIGLCFGCSSGFLEIYPETTLNEGNFYKSENEYILLTNGCYVPMRNYYKEAFWVLSEIPSDNSSFQYCPHDGGGLERRNADLFQVTANDGYNTSFWNTSYDGITRCNKLIYEILKSDASIWKTGGYKERCLGEGYFLRALYYFNLVRQFGGVPLVVEPISSQDAVNIKRSEESVIYDQIILDLNQSVALFEIAKDKEETGRANHAASLTLLGKVYLTLQRYKETETVLQKVLDMKKYSLLPNYSDLFNPSNKDYIETIYAIQYSENNKDLSNQFCFFFAPWGSKGDITHRPNININNGHHGWNQPTTDLIEAFEVGDKRKDASIGYWYGKDWDGIERNIPYCCKFKSPVTASDNRCSDNFPVLRYADVLLMLAEALNEQGETAKAIPFVEQVRNRAEIDMPKDLNKAKLSELIEKERRVEFCFENQRWYDLKRTGKALEVLKAHGAREKSMKPYLSANTYLLEEYMLLLPIPPDEILLNGLEQNPGY